MGVVLVFGGSTFPATLDALPHVVDFTHDVSADHINTITDALENIETKLGADSSADPTSVDYILHRGRHESAQPGGDAASIAYIFDTTNAHFGTDILASFRSDGVERAKLGGGGATDTYLELGSGQAALVSAAGRGRLIYNATLSRWQISVDGGGYANVSTDSSLTMQQAYQNGAAIITNANGSIDITRGVGTPAGDGGLIITDLNAATDRTAPLLDVDDQGVTALGSQTTFRVSHKGSAGTITAIRSEVAGSLDTVWQSGLVGGATITARIYADGDAVFGGNAMVGTEKLLVVGNTRTEGAALFLETTDPTTAVNTGALYTKDNSGATELYYRHASDGSVERLTGRAPTIDLSFNDSVEGVTAVVVGSVYFAESVVLTTESHAMLGTQAGGTAYLRLRRFSNGVLVTNATWSVTGVGLASDVIAAAATIPAAGWYDIELYGDIGGTISLLKGLHLEF